jgi:zinc transport system ATP-binding protein
MPEIASDSPPGTVPCLEFDHVVFGYDSKPVIEDVTFAVGRGEFAAVLGPNGSGKTTLLKLGLGLARPTRGTVALFGERPDRFRQWDRVGYIPQAVEGLSAHFPSTVEEVVVQGLYRGFDPLAIWRRNGQGPVIRALETAGVADLRGKRISSLSVGQQQRTLIARALVRQPELLVLDEPVAGVDAAGQEQLYDMLRRLNSENGITILMVSHDIGAVMRAATTVACINRSLVFHGPPHRLTQQELSTLYGMPMDVLLHDALHEHR